MNAIIRELLQRVAPVLLTWWLLEVAGAQCREGIQSGAVTESEKLMAPVENFVLGSAAARAGSATGGEAARIPLADRR